MSTSLHDTCTPSKNKTKNKTILSNRGILKIISAYAGRPLRVSHLLTNQKPEEKWKVHIAGKGSTTTTTERVMCGRTINASDAPSPQYIWESRCTSL